MKTRVSSLLLFAAFTLLAPTFGTSEAAQPEGASLPDAVLYELVEYAEFTSTGFRNATSALEGTARRGSPLCPLGLQAYAKVLFSTAGITVKLSPRCTVVALGQSQIDLTTFSGQMSGDFWVVVNSDATNFTDAQELVVMNGTFVGQIRVTDPEGRIIDILPGSAFTPTAALPGFPLPPTATFSGKFRLPYTIQDSVAVYKSDQGLPVRVLPHERALGDPTVRVEVDFD